MLRVFTGLYRAMEQGAALAQIAERHASNPATMADAIRGYLSPREGLSLGEMAAASATLALAVEVEELAA